MNIYVVVEGEKASKKLYQHWATYTNTNLKQVDYLTEVTSNNLFVVAGFGQSQIKDVVRRAVLDINETSLFDRLVVAIDSEGEDPLDKQIELSRFISALECKIEVRYIVQHVCLETWLLGNRQIFRSHTKNPTLLGYKEIFDIRLNDPVDLPPHIEFDWNRAKFAYEYLRAGIRDVYTNQNVTYSKSNSSIAAQQGYFEQVKSRHLKEKHIATFSQFLSAFAP